LRQQRENEELRERIKSLEKGWETVINALQMQGLPTGMIQLSNPQTPLTTLSTSAPTAQPSSTASAPSPSSKPISAPKTINHLNAFPSPAPSNSSLDFDIDNLAAGPNSPTSLLATAAPSPLFTGSSVTSTTSFTPAPSNPAQASESTRHLARVASIDAMSMPQQRVNLERSLESTPLVSLSVNTFPRYTTVLAHMKASALVQTRTKQWRTCSARSSSRRLLRRLPIAKDCPSNKRAQHPRRR
jgi:hypothetical protein